MKAIISKYVKHQNIGGKEIIIEKELTGKDIIDTDFSHMSIAMSNFIARRSDIFLYESDEKIEKMKVYYGHVGNLGYFVFADEVRIIEK